MGTHHSVKAIRLVVGVLALFLVLGLSVAQSVDAKGKEPPMADRVHNLNQQCTDGGGTASNQVLEGGSKMVTHCDGGAADGASCTITRDNTVCKNEGHLESGNATIQIISISAGSLEVAQPIIPSPVQTVQIQPSQQAAP